jgi:MerR family transcriptional regulator/heat shock protein HspR
VRGRLLRRDPLENLRRGFSGDDEPVYQIGVAAEMVGVHAQTVRHYERVGLIEPRRSEGNIRLFSRREVERMRAIAWLTGDLGINLSGVEIILELHRQVEELRREAATLRLDLLTRQGRMLEDHRRT